MDLSRLSDVELLQRYLATVSKPYTLKQVDAVETEGRRRGPERMAAAQKALGNTREAAREDSVSSAHGEEVDGAL